MKQRLKKKPNFFQEVCGTGKNREPRYPYSLSCAVRLLLSSAPKHRLNIKHLIRPMAIGRILANAQMLKLEFFSVLYPC